METSAPKAILASPYTPPSLTGEALWKQHISKKKVSYLTLSVMLPLWTVVRISSFQKKYTIYLEFSSVLKDISLLTHQSN